jgi:hypothetical protein
VTLPLDLTQGTRVRVLGRYRRRRVTMRLDRPPVFTDDTATSAAAVMLCGYQRTEGPRGASRRFVVRFVEPSEPVEVIGGP